MNLRCTECQRSPGAPSESPLHMERSADWATGYLARGPFCARCIHVDIYLRITGLIPDAYYDKFTAGAAAAHMEGANPIVIRDLLLQVYEFDEFHLNYYADQLMKMAEEAHKARCGNHGRGHNWHGHCFWAFLWALVALAAERSGAMEGAIERATHWVPII